MCNGTPSPEERKLAAETLDALYRRSYKVACGTEPTESKPTPDAHIAALEADIARLKQDLRIAELEAEKRELERQIAAKRHPQTRIYGWDLPGAETLPLRPKMYRVSL